MAPAGDALVARALLDGTGARVGANARFEKAPKSMAICRRLVFTFFALTVSACSASSGVVEGSDQEDITGGECSPSRANGAVNRYEKALHDAIAYSEGTKDKSKDGYNVGYAYKTFSSCAR